MRPYGGQDARACTCCGSADKRCRGRERAFERTLLADGLSECEEHPGEVDDFIGCRWCGADHWGGGTEPNGICEPGYGMNVGPVAPGGDA